jgi:hypothetical protein
LTPSYYDPELDGVGDWVHQLVAGARSAPGKVKGAAARAGRAATREGIDRARKLLLLLQDAIRKWGEADAIRARLPREYSRRIPSSRSRVVRGIMAGFERAGAVVPRSVATSGLGIEPTTIAVIGIGTVALVGTAAAVAVIAAASHKVVKEHRLAVEAKRKADLAMAAWTIEQRETSALGPDVAAQRRRERVEGAASLFASEPPSAAEPAGGLKLPWWVLPAGIGIGALALFGGQKYTRGRR